MGEEPTLQNSPELSLFELVDTLWVRRWFIVGLTAACMVATLIATFVMPKEYEVFTTLLPATEQSGTSQLGGLGAMAAQLGGFASLAGLSLGADDMTQEVIATLQSETLTLQYIKQENLLPVLFPKRWNAATGTWKEGKEPTPWEAIQYFKKDIRAVTENTRSGIITLSITWKDPQQATQWANGLVKLTNEYLREKALTESDRNAAYLTKQASETSIVEVRNAIYSLLESEIKNQMVARGRDEYALRTVDPAIVPDRASSPRKVVWVFAAACLGVILSAGIVLVQKLYSERRVQRA